MFRAHVITWDTIHLHGSLWRDHHYLRKQVFVDQLNYQVPHTEWWEWDQYDTPNAVYLVVEYQGQVVSSCRLVPTTGPYMIRDVFPDMYEGALPARKDTWEMTRIFASNFISEGTKRSALLALLLVMQEFCLRAGISSLLALMPDTIFRSIEKRGDIQIHVCEGKSREVDGLKTSILSIDVSKRMREKLRRKLSMEESKHALSSTNTPMEIVC